MYRVGLQNGLLELRSAEALSRVEKMTLDGELWVYISELINKDVEGSSSSEKLDELKDLVNTILQRTSGEIGPSKPVDKQKETPSDVKVVKPKIGGTAANVLNRMKGFNKG